MLLLIIQCLFLYGFPGCFAGMAPKNPNTGKRQKGNTSTSNPQPTRSRSYDPARFKSAYHQDRYRDLLERNTWAEKVFNIQPDGPYVEFLQFFLHQGWGRLLQPKTNIHADLLREFYANALLENPQTDPFVFETFVRGRTIRFDREAINAYLGNPFPLPNEDSLDDFHKKQKQGAFDLDPLKEEIKRTILLEGTNYDISDAGREYRAQYKFMTPSQTCP